MFGHGSCAQYGRTKYIDVRFYFLCNEEMIKGKKVDTKGKPLYLSLKSVSNSNIYTLN